MDENKIAYLQMIQEPICRTSTNSAIFKGFAATIVAGVASLTYKDVNVWVLGFSFLPVFAFAILDVYYLILERKFRFLYEQVRIDEHAIDFSMQLTTNHVDIIKAKARIWDCVKSPSICLFYPLLISILIIVFILKLEGVI